MAKKSGLPIQKKGGIEVMVANGERLTSTGLCKQVLLSIQEVSIRTDLCLLKLEGCEMVLGAHWLRTLGSLGFF